jgi:hypothetical protein
MSMLLRLDMCKNRQPLLVERSHGVGMTHTGLARQSLLPVGREHCRRTEVSDAGAFDNGSLSGRIVGSQLIKQGAAQRAIDIAGLWLTSATGDSQSRPHQLISLRAPAFSRFA